MSKPKPWTPTPEAYARYLDREFELAAANIERSSPTSSQDVVASRRTLFAAMQFVIGKRPNRFARDPRRFGSAHRMAA